jgi:hypothetical protein
VAEETVALMWRQLLGKELRTEEGFRITSVYPGRSGGDSGPDFREAVIAEVGSRLTIKGDVEVHVKSSDWYRHGHHRNPAYNNVVLHVVLWRDSDSVTLRQDGKSIPLLCLSSALLHQAYLIPYHELPCCEIEQRAGRKILAGLLSAAGEKRFKRKALHFQAELEHEEAGQVLWRHLMRALGYSKNTRPFEELSRKAPLSSVQGLKGSILKQACLLGTAGLLPSQRSQEDLYRYDGLRELELAWQSLPQGDAPMTENDWNLWHIYPNNFPVRRIIAQSYILQRYGNTGLLQSLLQLVKESPQMPPGPRGNGTATAGHRRLEDGLTVFGDGYWQDHFDFNSRSKTRKSALLGKSKASEIVINVVLPFAFSWGEMTGDPGLQQSALRICRHYPELTGNEITRHMAWQLGLGTTAGLTACQQQGLIHIFRNYCREGKCCDCPLVSRASHHNCRMGRTLSL